MRMLTCAVALIVSAAGLSGASAFEGKWKMSPQDSKYTAGGLPKEEVIVIADKGNQLEVTIAGRDDDGKPIAISYMVPVKGGAGKMQQGGSYDAVSAKRVDDRTRDTTFSKGGEAVMVEHMVVSDDGKTMTVKLKGVDAGGKAVEGVVVLEKQ